MTMCAEADIVENRYQATDSEDIEDLVRTVMNCKCELQLYFFVNTSFKIAINPITDPNPTSSH
jgi:hypothetical protein